MNGKLILYIDQYGQKYFCRYIKELKTKHFLSGKISKMYIDNKNGKPLHIGYVIGQNWLRAYIPYKQEV
jgi:hypothetical protein